MYSSVALFAFVENQRIICPSNRAYFVGNSISYKSDYQLIIKLLLLLILGNSNFFVFYKYNKTLRFSPTSIKTLEPTPCNTHTFNTYNF